MNVFKFVSIFAVLLCVIMVFSACGEEKKHDWETELGYEERIAKGLQVYVNEDYYYAIDYPNIFKTIEQNDNGMQATGDGCTLKVWIEKGEAQPIYDELAQKHEFTEAYISETSMQAVYAEGDNEVYQFKMLNSGYMYSFEFTYPIDKKEEFTAYCADMINRYVIITPMSEIEKLNESETEETTGNTDSKIPQGDNVYGEVNSDLEALNLVRDTYAKDFTVMADGEMAYTCPEKPYQKLVFEGSTGSSYLIQLFEISVDADNKQQINTINWYRIVKKNGYCIMEPMIE